LPITLKKINRIRIINSTIINGKKEEPLKQEKDKVKILTMQTKSKKVLRSNG
jgi:hypothetical protein